MIVEFISIFLISLALGGCWLAVTEKFTPLYRQPSFNHWLAGLVALLPAFVMDSMSPVEFYAMLSVWFLLYVRRHIVRRKLLSLGEIERDEGEG